jgi:lipoate-protein ligase A
MPAASAALSVDLFGRSGAANMARDLALLRAARTGRVRFRLYRWDPPCLSFGRNESALTRYDVQAIDGLGLATVRRPTGGRAVWHDAEVTYAVAGSIGDFGPLAATYDRIHRLLAAALRRLGAPAELAPARRAPSTDAGACFAAPVGGEVVIEGRKVVGSAQLREGNAFLQHGSILLEDGQDVVARVTRGRVSQPTGTSLAATLGRRITFDEVATAVRKELEAAFIVEPVGADAPDPTDLARFANADWTWRR